MSLKDRVVRRLARRFKVEDSLDFLDATAHVGAKADVALPTDLLPMAARMVTRAVFTQQAIQPNLDWVLPYWATRQFDERDVSFIPRMSWASMNVTHRNWTAVGVPGSTREVVVDPRGWVTPWFEGWSLDAWLDVEGEMLFPSRQAAVEQRHVDNLPLVLTAFDTPRARLEIETFATVVDGVECVLVQATVRNRSDGPLRPTLYFSIRPFNPEGASLVKMIEAVTPETLTVNGSLGLTFDRAPDRVHCSTGRDGDCAFFVNADAARTKAECPAGLATAYARFTLRLERDEAVSVIACAPTQPVKYAPKKAVALRAFDYADRRADARAVWRKNVGRGFELSLPDAGLATAFQLCKAHLLLADDGDCITPGVMTYHHYWFRDSAYLVTALDRLGLHADAERKLRDYPSRQRKDGFFLSQPGEWDSAGQAIWTLVEHARLTGDRAFLERVYEPILRGADWLVRTRKQNDRPGPTRGLLPPGLSAEHFGPNDNYYWDDFWGAAGLRDAAWTAETLSLRNDWIRFEREAGEFLADIRQSLRLLEPKLGQAIMPVGPHRRFDCAAVGSIAALYPLRLLDPHDPLITNTLNGLHDKHMVENGFFQQMIHSGINAYLTMHMAHCHVLRREVRCWPLLHYILSRATSVGVWPEAIHPKTGGGSMGDGMHLWAAADFLLLLRDLLLFEDGDTLVITPAPLPDWFAWGSRLELRRAPTYFGEVSYRLEGFADEVRLELDAAWRRTPLRLEWNAPFPIETAVVDGREINVNDYRLIVPGGVSEIRIKRT
jgi:hypothetical protein